MSDATRNSILQLLTKTLELAQTRGTFDLDFASILHKSFLLLNKEPKSVLQNEQGQMNRVDAANNLRQGLTLTQEKGGIIGNIETGIQLKKAADLLVHMEGEDVKTSDDKPPMVYSEDDLYQMRFELSNDITKDSKPLRLLAEGGQQNGFIRLEVLEQVETALRRLENSKMLKSEQKSLQEALEFMKVLCFALQKKGGLIAELRIATDYKTLFEKLSFLIENLQDTESQASVEDSNIEMVDSEPVMHKRLRA